MTQLSIVVCTRNRADRLEPMFEALRAIRSRHDWELLLINNNSTDDTLAVLTQGIAQMPNARVETVKAIGLGAARDAAWRMAQGAIILFTDDDCYPAADIVDNALAVFENHPGIGFCGGRIMLHDPNDARVTIDERNVPVDYEPYTFANTGMMHGANMVFRRHVLEKTGGFDPMFGAGTVFPCEDIDAFAAALWAGFPGRFDPSFSVRHHHGRKLADVPALRAAYDSGRGAYYAKYMLRDDTRAAYLKGWYQLLTEDISRNSLHKLRREVRSAFRYLRIRKKSRYTLLAAPFVAAAFIVVGAAVPTQWAIRLISGGKPSSSHA